MIDAETTMNLEVDVEQVTKQEVHYEEKDLQNEEKVQKILQRYKNRITDLHKIIHHQKRQNDNLKIELKVLNNQLNSVIDKIGHKSQAVQKKQSRDETVRKELQNEIKKSRMQQTQINQLRAKVKTFDSQKTADLYNELKEKQSKIVQLNQKIKTLQKAEKVEKNMDIYKKQEQLNQKVSSLNEEIMHLKNKLEKQKKHEEVLNKSIKAQHQQILNLDSKNKLQKSETRIQSPQKHNNSNSLIEELSKLKENYENLQITKKATEKHLRYELEMQKQRTKVLQKQVDEANNIIKRKDKEANILSLKMKETQRKNYNTLQPVQRIRNSEDFSTTGIFDQRKQFKGLVHIQGNYRKFDDTQALSLQKNYRIKKFVFTWFQEHILSLDTTYQLRDGSQKQVSSFKLSHNYKNIKFGDLVLQDFEYIKDIEIYCFKFIEFMRIRTSRERVLQVGNQKNTVKCKKSSFDIRSHEKPIAFLGAIDNKKIVGMDKNNEVLISLGLEIKKKDIQGKTRFNFGRTDSLQKYNSRTALDRHSRNDKNIIDQQ